MRALITLRFSPSHTDEAAQPPCLDRVSRDRIVALLRAAYEEVASAPIPNEHIDLLLALRHIERERRRELGSNASPFGECLDVFATRSEPGEHRGGLPLPARA